ncbi:response regulator transcription factor [Clostridium sp.]|uniref:response regulator transcription factor n=1 Tax=Clostridium sp. TaxID=1506 RepID=UPI00261F6493|nr:response regulator transcription factor [Clostridium sp.]
MGKEKFNVLVVDDEKEIRDAIDIYLRGEGINVIKACDGIEALEILDKEDIHLVVLDIMMPRLDGRRTCLKIRESRNIPIILLSAKSEDSDKILGLNIGADDYVTKPFNHLELVARVKSQLRRYDYPLNRENTQDLIVIKDLTIDTVNKQVSLRGENIKLTATEYKILTLLASHPGRIFSIKEIYERVWEEPFYKSENTVTVHIRRMREKIEINSKDPEYIKVVWGLGYKIDK